MASYDPRGIIVTTKESTKKTLDENLVRKFKRLPKGARQKILATLKTKDNIILVDSWIAKFDDPTDINNSIDCGCLMMDGGDVSEVRNTVQEHSGLTNAAARYLIKFYKLRGDLHNAKVRITDTAWAYDDWAREPGLYRCYHGSDCNGKDRRLLSESGRKELIKLLTPHI